MSLVFLSSCFRLYKHKDLSDCRALQWMKGLAEYIVVFSLLTSSLVLPPVTILQLVSSVCFQVSSNSLLKSHPLTVVFLLLQEGPGCKYQDMWAVLPCLGSSAMFGHIIWERDVLQSKQLQSKIKLSHCHCWTHTRARLGSTLPVLHSEIETFEDRY